MQDNNIVTHPALQKLIDKSKDELVTQCENLIDVLNGYKLESIKLGDLVDTYNKVAESLKVENDTYLTILRHLQRVANDETLSITEQHTKLHTQVCSMSLPAEESKDE